MRGDGRLDAVERHALVVPSCITEVVSLALARGVEVLPAVRVVETEHGITPAIGEERHALRLSPLILQALARAEILRQEVVSVAGVVHAVHGNLSRFGSFPRYAFVVPASFGQSGSLAV